ncbi:hypothetical protein [Parasitella parasitica]|uniref:Tc1-like transposase DDE domain-containing protein n=1 Tax=Parasitella parasitica TaxID=35722 RepID=A0A0B7MU77_9FUNG|nr:hypothetical protein [Parasitella parasitica]
MQEDTDFYQIDNMEYESQIEDDRKFAINHVTIMSLMRPVEITEEAMEIDQSLVEELQMPADEEDHEQEPSKQKSYKAPLQKNKTKKTCRNEHQDVPDIWKPRGPPKAEVLKEVQKFFVRDLIDCRGTYTLEFMHEALMNHFPEKVQQISEYRNADETKLKRKIAVQGWLADKSMEFDKNCVFLDEAGINLYISRTRGWSRKGTPCKVLVPKSKGKNITILGAISSAGIIDVSLRIPEVLGSASKKRSADGKVINVTAKVGTRTEHFYNYLQNMLQVLNKNNLHGQYIVMKNAPIHKNESIRELIESQGHKCVYLPPYSPFLNPIEEFWSKVKYHIKRTALDTNDTLTPRITKACETVKVRSGTLSHSFRIVSILKI